MSVTGNFFKAIAISTACLSLLFSTPVAKAQSGTPYLEWNSGGFEVWTPNGQSSGAPSLFVGTSYQETVSVSGLPAGASANIVCYDTAQGQILSWSTSSDNSYVTSWTPQHGGPNNVNCTLSYSSPSGSGDIETGVVSIQVYDNQ
jgi:hypothetical protein